ncbi:kinesin light chain [Candidatus Omnitrophus magneticus]|uniref:Kinesin light chain n=1 Tax=Candidatus Omnitrophus magneticus TaxID=1609969 RepID=A0A0F0CIX6_9BACT|nr:kinesin light chain [Candidatus Omnitrophus magneticus]
MKKILAAYFFLIFLFCGNLCFSENIDLDKLSEDIIKLYDDAKYSEAIEPANKLYNEYLKCYGQSHPKTIYSLSNLAIIYEANNEYDKAEECLKSLLEITKKTHGENGFEVTGVLDDLVKLYYVEDKYKDALPVCLRSLKIKEIFLGRETVEIFPSIYMLANIYYKDGQYEKAKEEYQKLIKLSERILGVSNEDTLKIKKEYEEMLEILSKKTSSVSDGSNTMPAEK